MDRDVLQRLRLAVLDIEVINCKEGHRAVAERGFRARGCFYAAAEVDPPDRFVAHHIIRAAFGDPFADIHGKHAVDEARYATKGFHTASLLALRAAG